MGLSFTGKLRGKELTVWLLLVVTVGGLVFSNTLSAPFVLDDINSIVQNKARHSIDWSLNNLLGTRTIPYFTLDLNYHWGKLNVVGYHLVNIGLHLLVTILVTLLLYKISKASFKVKLWRFGRWRADSHWLMAIVGGLLFLIHPIQTQSVNYIVQRMVLITTLFYVGALLSYWLFREASGKKAWSWAGLSLLVTVLAMHSKEIAITLPMAIVVIEYVFFAKDWRVLLRRWWKLLPWLLTILIIPAYMMEVRDVFIQGVGLPDYAREDTVIDKVSWRKVLNVSAETKDVSRSVYAMTEAGVVVQYIRLIVWPRGLNIDHDVPWQDKFSWRGVGLPLFVIVAVWLMAVWWYRKGYRVGAVGVVIFFMTLSVESSIIPISDAMFEHRLYLPMVGIALVVLELFGWGERKMRRFADPEKARMIFLWLVIICLMVLAGVAYERNNVWRSALAMWTDATQKSPTKARPLNNLGLAYVDAKRYKEAEETYKRVLVKEPDNIEALINLGVLYGQQRRLGAAEKMLNRAITIAPDNMTGYVNLGNVMVLKGDLTKAEEMYRIVLAKHQVRADVWASLGDVLIKQGKADEAIEVYLKALAEEPEKAGWLNRVGALYAMKGSFDEAEAMFERALSADPGLVAARDNLNRLNNERAKKSG